MEQDQLSDHVASCSSSTLKRYEEVRKDQEISPDPTLTGQQSSSRSSLQDGQQPEENLMVASASSQFFYMSRYRRYFGLISPYPRLFNPQLLEDYIDWYINVYMEEELPWQ